MTQAAELAGAAEFITRLPQGYDTEIGERGTRLSAGQVQRIAIARAFLKNAPLLVLDEPTSSLDPESETRIRQALERLVQDRTVLVIAHRLNTIAHAEQVAVLEGGRLVEIGCSAELVQRNGAYAQLIGACSKSRQPTPPSRLDPYAVANDAMPLAYGSSDRAEVATAQAGGSEDQRWEVRV